MKKVLIRADANSSMGAGHVMRSVALAQYLNSQNVYVRFLTVTDNKKLSEYLKKQKFDTHFINRPPNNDDGNLQAVLNELHEGFDWVVLDHYGFMEKHNQKICEANVRLLVMSDVPPYSKYADIVLNHALQDKESESNNSSYLFGIKYALIRQELIQASKGEKKSRQNVLVTLGGSSFPDLLKKIVNSINLLTEFKLHVKILRGFLVEIKETKTHIDQHLIEYCKPSFEAQHFFNWADLSISAGGGTSWELCFFGVIGLVGIVADNQTQIVHNLDRQKVFKSVGWFKDCSEASLAKELRELLTHPNLITQMRTNAHKLVDGKGPERIFQAMQKVERLKVKI